MPATDYSYSTGNISITSGTNALTGVGTSWLSSGLIYPGDAVWRVPGAGAGPFLIGYVDVIVSNTAITLKDNYYGTTLSALGYTIVYSSWLRLWRGEAEQVQLNFLAAIAESGLADSVAGRPAAVSTVTRNNQITRDFTNGGLWALRSGVWELIRGGVGTTIASAPAGVLNLDAADGELVDLNFTTTVTAVTLAAGQRRTCRVSSAGFSMTASASLLIAGGSVALVTSDRVIFYGHATYTSAVIHRASGRASTEPTAAELGVREKLTATRTYYVRIDGSDSNTGLVDSAGGAFLTIQKAVNVILTLDLGGFFAIIQVRAGTYTGTINITQPFVGGLVVLIGDITTPTNCVISTTNTCIKTNGLGIQLAVRGFKVQNTVIGHALHATNGSQITIDGLMNFGAIAQGHFLADNNGKIVVSTNYTVSGAASRHWWAEADGQIVAFFRTITISGTPAFSIFAFALGGYINVPGNTFSGAATGKRYSAVLGRINTNNQGANYLPGNSAGTVGTGGFYN